jgi:RimJ/RimL family protein N-acetyltransferase/acyl carrier protein
VEKPVKDLGKEEALDRFAGEIRKLSSERYYIFISLGMTDEERKLAAESLQQGYLTKWPLQKSENDVPVSFLADLYAYGAGIDFETFYQGKSWQTVTLPPYPFERKRLRPQGCDASLEKTFSSPSLSSVDRILSRIHPGLTCLVVQQEIASAFTEALVRVLGYKADEIDIHTKFGDFGINSIITAQLIGIVELRLGIEAAPTLFGRYNTIASLSTHLARQYKNMEELETGTLALATPLSKITLVKAGYEHFDTVRKWLDNSEIHTWLDPFFQKNLTAMEFGFFLKKGDKKTFLIIYDSTPVGICGIVDLDEGNKTGETWLVIGEHSGRAAGMSVAAGEMLCKKAFGDFSLQTLTVKIRVDNEPALSMMRYAGWREVGILFDSLRVGDSFHHRYLYQLTKTEFKARMEGSSRNDSV